MKQGWEDYEKASEKGPLSLAVKAMVGIIALIVLIGTVAYAFSWCGEAGQVAREEYGPRAALRKYEWFKDTAQMLQKQQADIQVQEAALAQMKTDYGAEMTAWPRDVRETYEQRRAELIGIKDNFNRLAAEYNAAVLKVNWSAMNVDHLDSEYHTYVTQ